MPIMLIANWMQNPQGKQPPAQTSPVESQSTGSANQRDAAKTLQPPDKPYSVVVKKLPPKEIWDKAYVVLTMCLVVVGVATLTAVWLQAIETREAAEAATNSLPLMQEANRINLESLQAVQRAYVTFPYASESRDIPIVLLTDSFGIAVSRRFQLPIDNTGNAPAQHVLIHVSFMEIKGPDGLPADFNYPDVGDGVNSSPSLPARSRIFTGHLELPRP